MYIDKGNTSVIGIAVGIFHNETYKGIHNLKPLNQGWNTFEYKVPEGVNSLLFKIYKDVDDKLETYFYIDNFKLSLNRLEIIEEANYYPFGLKHKGYNNVVSASGNAVALKFGYNGKELNEELGLEWHDFGTRNYDASLGRWMNIDPLAEEMRRHSPYNYAFNNPIYFTDPDGMMPVGLDNMDEEKNFDNAKFDFQPNYFASTVVDNAGKIIDYKDDGDNNIYLNTRSEENIIGQESAGSQYIVGQTIYGRDIFSDAKLPEGFYVAINPNGPDQNKVTPIGGLGLLEYVGGGGLFKWKSLVNIFKSIFKGKKLYSKAIYKAFQKQLQQHGKKSVFKSQKKIQRRLTEHLKKLKEIKKAGGHTSSVEREITTFKAQLQAIKDVLK